MALLWLLLLILTTTVSAAEDTSDENILHVNLNIPRESKKSYGYVEDAYLNFTELALKYGYPVEEHILATDDGYIVKLFRIPHGRNSSTIGPPVLAVHGLMDSPDTWIFPGPGYGLGYLMVDAGYDVWCASLRGGKYTRKHVTLDPDNDVKFWKFSSDEMSAFDIPAMIDYILKERNATSLAYVGHSLGTRLFYELGMYHPEIYKKVNVMISMASTPWLTHSTVPLLRIITLVLPQLEFFSKRVGLQEFFGGSSALSEAPQLLCAGGTDRFTDPSLNRFACSLILFSLFGIDLDQIRQEIVPVIYGHAPTGASMQTLIHMGQGIHSSKFQRYDRGVEGNLKAYGSETPPEYDVSLVTTPVALFRGRSDMLSTYEDVEKLKMKLPNVVENYIVPRANWQHVNYIWGKDAPRLVGDKIIEIFKRYAV